MTSGRALLTACLLVVACNKPSEKAEPVATGSAKPLEAAGAAPAAPAAPAAGPQSRCEIKVTGDLETTVVGSKPRGAVGADMQAPMASSDYWMTDEELRSGLASMARIGEPKASPAAIDAIVDDAMKMKDPRFLAFMLMCAGKDGSVTFNTGKHAQYKNVPFAPKSYQVLTYDQAEADAMTVSSIHFGNGEARQYFEISEPGTLELKTFDDVGVTGTFSFKAASKEGKKVQIDGVFDISCTGRKCKK